MKQQLTVFQDNNRKGGLKYIIDMKVLSKLEDEFDLAVEKASLAVIDCCGNVKIINKESEN